MDALFSSLISVILFSFCCYMFGRTVFKQQISLGYSYQGYSRSASRIGWKYQVFAWAILMIYLLYTMSLSFWTVFTQL